MASVNHDSVDQWSLRGHLSDLTAVLALPAMWKGRDPRDVTISMLDVLGRLLRLDDARARLSPPPDGCPAVEESWSDGAAGFPADLFDHLDDVPSDEALIATSTVDPRRGTPVRIAAVRWRILGAPWQVWAGSRRLDFPTDPERFLLRVTVEQAALAIETAILLGRGKEARAELETVHRIGQALVAELDLEKLAQRITDAATALSGARIGSFFYNVVDERGESLALYTLSGAPRSSFPDLPMTRNTPLFAPTFRGEAIIRLDDVRQDPRYAQNPPYHGLPPNHPPVASYLAVPVITRSGEVLGSLFFGHPAPAVFTERSERIVAGLAAQAAIALDNARLYEKARRDIRARDEFLGAVAHDLRTPLTSIKGNAQMMRHHASRLSPPLDNHLVASLERIERTTTKMAALIDELLDVERIELGQPIELERSPTDLVALARRVVAEQQLTTRRHQIRVETAENALTGRWDRSRLERVLDNLLSNAVKYSPNGGEIVVSITAPLAHAEIAEAVLAVRDPGIGIPTRDLPHIFERFYRAANAAGRIVGAGLGLTGVQRIIRLHGGSVSVDSREGAGSTFTVRLPL